MTKRPALHIATRSRTNFFYLLHATSLGLLLTTVGHRLHLPIPRSAGKWFFAGLHPFQSCDAIASMGSRHHPPVGPTPRIFEGILHVSSPACLRHFRSFSDRCFTERSGTGVSSNKLAFTSFICISFAIRMCREGTSREGHSMKVPQKTIAMTQTLVMAAVCCRPRKTCSMNLPLMRLNSVCLCATSTACRTFAGSRRADARAQSIWFFLAKRPIAWRLRAR